MLQVQTTLSPPVNGLLPAFAASPEEIAAERFARAALNSGMPLDQLLAFLKVGVVLQPKQCEASAVARVMNLPGGPEELGYGGARGGGKSHWMLAQMGADDCQRYPGLKCLLLRKVGKSLAEAFQDLVAKCLGHKSILGYRFTPSRGLVTFKNGSQIILGHFQNESDIAKYLGLEYDVIGIEEATTLTKQKIEDIGSCNRSSKTFLDAKGRRIPFKPKIYTTTNPGGVGHAYYFDHFVKPFQNKSQTYTYFIPATALDNAFNNPEYRERLNRLTGWRRRAWLLGDWDIAAGQFFTTFRRDQHTVSQQVCDSVLRVARRIWLALDWGFTHYTVILLFAQDGDGNIYVCAEHAQRRWLVKRHCEALREMLVRRSVLRSRIETFVAGGDVFAEKGDGGTVAQKFDDEGFALETARMSRINGWAEVQDRLGDPDSDSPELYVPPRLFLSENCARTLDCLPTLQHDPNNPEDVRKVDTDEEGDGGDDPADTLRYGVMVAASDTATGESLDARG